MRILAKSLLMSAVSAAAFVAIPAEAQTVTRIVAFGDSYADEGNLFQLLGIAPPPAYPRGRFSDSTNFVDTMAQILQVPVDNFAIGGAFTGSGNINGPGIPGFTLEYQSFLAGGGPAAFPRVSGKFSETDLLVVSIGGNDARAYERSLGLTPTPAQIQALLAGVPAQAQQRVAETATGLSALIGAGAQNITFLAGDVGRLPEVVGLPIAQVGSAYATAFNAGIRTQLATYANQGVIVNYLDLNRIGDVVSANLSSFGLISAGACPVACAANPDVARQFLFYVDQVHLTSRGFEIVGQYGVRQLEAPLQLQAQGEAGLQAARSFGGVMLGRLDLSSARFAEGHSGMNVWASGNIASMDRRRSLTSLAYDLETVSGSAGVEYDMSSGFIVGAAGAYTRSDSDFETGTGGGRASGWQLGGYAGWNGGGAFVQGYAGLGTLDYEISRDAVIDQISADPDGKTMTAGAEAGYLMPFGGVSIGPVVGVRYARAEIDGYTETGDPVLTLNVEDQSLNSLTGSAGIEARATYDVNGLSLQPYASASVEKEFEGNERSVRYALTAAPEIVNTFNLPGRNRDTYGRVTGGVNLNLGSALALQVQASSTLEHREGNEFNGSIALRLGF
ncbi:MAG TPA: autotransporter domain-containing protein [Allosphingosinicella sp.]|jgi:outer membrane autotransporter protein|nr:autotransporter domain-containing protein [Allosphingosinicella sp.]